MVALTNFWRDRSLIASMTVVWALLGLAQGSLGIFGAALGHPAGWPFAIIALGYFGVAGASAVRWRRLGSNQPTAH
jgi:hypothetical protein